jgi:hypothetical protein
VLGVVGPQYGTQMVNGTPLESGAIEGDSPVRENLKRFSGIPSTTGHVKSCGNLPGPPGKAKYSLPPIVNQYREGKVKRTPGGE